MRRVFENGPDPVKGGMPRPLRLYVILLISFSLLPFMNSCSTAKKRKMASLHRDLGITMINDGKPEEAILELKRSIKLNPKDPDAYHALGLAYFGKGILEKAEDYFLMALRMKPDYPQCSLNLGALYINMGKWDKAIEINEKLAENETYRSPARVFNNLGLAYFNVGKMEKAEIAFKKAIKIAPYFCLAHFNLGNLYRERGQTDLAISSFRKVVKYCPEDKKSSMNLGILLIEKGEIEEGRDILEGLKGLDPDGPYGREAERYLELIK